MRKIIALAIACALMGCQTNDAGKTSIDWEKVRLAATLTCGIAPTAAQVAQLYTDNKSVKTTDHAVALLCAAALPIVRIPDAPASAAPLPLVK